MTQKTLDRGASTFGKMDVGCAMSVFSKETAAAITVMIADFDYPQDYSATSQGVLEVAHWFQIMSCRNNSLAFSLKNPEAYEEQLEFLGRFMDFFGELQIYDDPNHALADVQKGVILSTTSILQVQQYLVKEGRIDSLKAARFLADVLENHHGNSRQMVKNPSPLQVERINKALGKKKLYYKILTHKCY